VRSREIGVIQAVPLATRLAAAAALAWTAETAGRRAASRASFFLFASNLDGTVLDVDGAPYVALDRCRRCK
jgi:hypothetical protein